MLIYFVISLFFHNLTYPLQKTTKKVDSKEVKEITEVFVKAIKFADFDIVSPIECSTISRSGEYISGNRTVLSLNIKKNPYWINGLKEIFKNETSQQWLFRKLNVSNPDDLEKLRPQSLDDISWFKQIDPIVGKKLEKLWVATFSLPMEVNIKLKKEKKHFIRICFQRAYRAVSFEKIDGVFNDDSVNPRAYFNPSGKFAKINLIILTKNGWIDGFAEEPIQ